mgnify:CR=1 FL=1
MVAAPVPFDMEADRTDPPSGKSRVDCVLPDMPPGDPPLQDPLSTLMWCLDPIFDFVDPIFEVHIWAQAAVYTVF